MAAEQSPKIVIVDESPIRAAILEEGLREAGYVDVQHIREMQRSRIGLMRSFFSPSTM